MCSQSNIYVTRDQFQWICHCEVFGSRALEFLSPPRDEFALMDNFCSPIAFLYRPDQGPGLFAHGMKFRARPAKGI